jgi:predicted ATP-grasp superfamily ATP-dependent carboligase
MSRVLITDGDQRAALACVRALGQEGHECFVIGPESGRLSGSSRYCRGFSISPDPMADPEGFLATAGERAEAWETPWLFPITEKSLRAILPNRDRFPGLQIPFPEAEVFSAVSDKSLVLARAREIGLAVPRQWEWESREDADDSAIPEDSFPLALKPPRSVRQLGRGTGQISVSYALNPSHLRDWIHSSDEASYPVLVQERVVGEGVGVFLLTWEEVLRGVVGHRRIREKPPSGGVSVVRESTTVSPDLLEKSLELLRQLGWSDGVAMVEYKVDPTTGMAWLMEINGRFWGSLQLAVNAGVNFPALLLRCAQGDPPSAPVRGTPGVRIRWLMGDVDQLLLRLFRSREELSLPDSVPGRVRAVWEFVQDFRPGTRSEVFRPSDPAPFLKEVGVWFRNLGA